jgi:hypothetical protein
MKYAITGHTGLIGGYLHKNLVDCVGFSRSNGFDITDDDAQDRIILESYMCDVFINCAHAGPGTSQTDMLWKVYQRWKDQDKHIINIGTDTASPHVWSTVRQDYPLEKSILAATVDHIQKQHDSRCRVSIINPNIVKEHTLIDIKNAVDFIVNSNSRINSINLQ